VFLGQHRAGGTRAFGRLLLIKTLRERAIRLSIAAA
jgi:hypothetical protein